MKMLKLKGFSSIEGRHSPSRGQRSSYWRAHQVQFPSAALREQEKKRSISISDMAEISRCPPHFTAVDWSYRFNPEEDANTGRSFLRCFLLCKRFHLAALRRCVGVEPFWSRVLCSAHSWGMLCLHFFIKSLNSLLPGAQ